MLELSSLSTTAPPQPLRPATAHLPAMTPLTALLSSRLPQSLPRSPPRAGSRSRPSSLLTNPLPVQWPDYQTLGLRIAPAVSRWAVYRALPRAPDQHVQNQIGVPTWVAHSSLNSAVIALAALLLPRAPPFSEGWYHLPDSPEEMLTAPGLLRLPYPHPLSCWLVDQG